MVLNQPPFLPETMVLATAPSIGWSHGYHRVYFTPFFTAVYDSNAYHSIQNFMLITKMATVSPNLNAETFMVVFCDTDLPK